MQRFLMTLLCLFILLPKVAVSAEAQSSMSWPPLVSILPPLSWCVNCDVKCKCIGVDENGVEIWVCESGFSTINSLGLSYMHEALDYQVPGVASQAGCAPCGAQSGTDVSGVKGLQIRRLMSYSYGMGSSVGSLGWGHGFDFDVSLKVYTDYLDQDRTRVLVMDPGNPGRRGAFFSNHTDNNEPTGVFGPSGQIHSFRDIRLYADAACTTPVLVADEGQFACLTYLDGQTQTFELVRTDDDSESTNLRGRLIRWADRNGNAQSITYAFPADASDETVGYNRMKFLQMDSLSDPFGQVATFTYANTWYGRGLIERIDLPNGQHITYSFGNIGTANSTYGNPGTRYNLRSVGLPDGTASTFDYGYDTTSQFIWVDIQDAAAEGTHRNKRVFFTASSWVDPQTGEVHNQSLGRVRAVANGAGELGYLTWAEGDEATTLHRYVYTGGNRLKRITTTKAVGHNKPLSVAYAKQWDWSTPVSEWVFENEGNVTWNQWDYLQSTFTDANGLTTSYTWDFSTRKPTQITYSDGTFETKTYNAFSQVTQHVDRLGRITTTTYDAKGNRLSRIRAVGTVDEATWNWAYNSAGQEVSAIDANGNITTRSYTPVVAGKLGYLSQINEPSDIPAEPAITRTFSYNSAGIQTETVDGGGHVVRYERDANNRIIAIVYGFYPTAGNYYEHSREHIIYGTGINANLITKQIDRNGVVREFTYDAHGRRIQTIQAVGTAESIQETCSYVSGTNLKETCTKAGETLTHSYDYRNRLTSTTRQANGTTFLTNNRILDGAGRMLKSTDAYGRATYTVYDTNNRILRRLQETIAGGITDPYLYLSNGSINQASVIASQNTLAALARDPNPNAAYLITDSIYDAEGQRIASIDARAILHTSSYDFQGRLVAQTEAVANVTNIEVAYAAHTDTFGFIHAVDAFGAMTQTPTSIAATSSVTYDAQGNRLTSTNPRGFITAYTYTQRNLVDAITEAAGTADEATRFITYTATRKQATTTDFRGNTTSYSYYPCCDWLAQVTDPTGAVTSYVYDFEQHVVSLTDPNGNTTNTIYDSLYRVKTRTNAESETTTYAYDDNATNGNGLEVLYAAQLTGLGLTAGSDGQIIAVTNAEGETSVQIRDGLGRTVRTVDALNHTNTTHYDVVVAGLLEVSATDALGHINRNRTDAVGRRLESIDAENNSSTFQYDANSNRINYRDANGVGQDCEFDARNRDISCTDTQGDTTTRQYDANSNVIVQTDGLGEVNTCTFDARDRRVSCTDRINATTAYSYDSDNNLLTIIDAEGGPTTYAYDSRSLLVDEMFPAGNAGTTRRLYSYDAGRRLIQRTVTTLETPTVVEDTSYLYDMANRLLTRTYPQEANKQDQFAYDDASRLTAATSQRYSNLINRSYDAASRLISESLSIDGSIYTIHYSYDDANRQTRIIYPDGKVITRSYTDRNQLESVGVQGELTSLITSLYDAGQREINRTYGNGLVAVKSYRADNLISNIAVGSVLNLSYDYDGNKRKTVETDALHAAASQTFNYDSEDRLTGWAGNNNTQSWNLSAVGDWNATTTNGTIENRTHTAVHEVTSIDNTPLAYDFKGNLTSHSNGQLYAWDSENRMKAAHGTLTGDYTNVDYRYDALGRRVAQTTTEEITIPAGALHHVDAAQMTTWGETANIVSDPDRGDVLGYNAGALDNLSSLIQNLNGQPAFTISIWAKADEIPTDKGLFKTNATEDDSAKSIYLRYDKEGYNSGTATEIIKGGVDTTGGRLKYESADHTQTTEWQHFTMSWESGDRIRLFIDGIEDEPSYENGSAEGVLQNITGFILGRSVKDNAANASWEGLLDDLRIYDRALTPTEVSNLHTADQHPTQNSGTTVAITNTTTYICAGAQVIQEYTNNMLGNSYAYATYVDEPVALIKPDNTKYYYHQNHLYSVEAITDANAQVVETYNYDAYGKTFVYDAANNLIDESAVENPYGFTGRRIDNETGLYYFRARYYDVDLGRFIGRDRRHNIENARGLSCDYSVLNAIYSSSARLNFFEKVYWEISGEIVGFGRLSHFEELSLLSNGIAMSQLSLENGSSYVAEFLANKVDPSGLLPCTWGQKVKCLNTCKKVHKGKGFAYIKCSSSKFLCWNLMTCYCYCKCRYLLTKTSSTGKTECHYMCGKKLLIKKKAAGASCSTSGENVNCRSI